MAEIISLLAFPKVSNAFDAPRLAASVRIPGSPPRKIARLGSIDSDAGPRNPPVPVILRQSIKLSGFDVTRSSEAHDALYSTLSRNIHILLTPYDATPLNATHERLYRACRTLVCHGGRGEQIVGVVRLELERGVGKLAKALSAVPNPAADHPAGVEWLRPFVDACEWFEGRVNMLQAVLTYLDRVYILEHMLPSIKDIAFRVFREKIFDHAAIDARLRLGAQEWADWERKNRSAHKLRPTISALIAHLLTFGYYPALFLLPYAEHLRASYAAEAAALGAPAGTLADDPAAFLEHCRARIAEERDRCAAVGMPADAAPLVAEAAERAFVDGRLPWLAHDGLARLIDRKDLPGLRELYTLFARVNGVKALTSAFKDFIQSAVQTIVTDTVQDDSMIERLLELRAFALSAVTGAFSPSPSPSSAGGPASDPAHPRPFFDALRDALKAGFGARLRAPAALLARHLDRLLRAGPRGTSDAAFARTLDAAVALSASTDDRDVFRAFYHRALAKRLLLGRSASDDFEKEVLKKLAAEDADFGMGEKMFKDLTLSRDLMHEYRAKDVFAAPTLSVMVLEQGVWPFSAPAHIVDLPPSMQDDLTRYGAFYKDKHTNHRLAWDHSLATATLHARFAGGEKDLAVSMHQTVVLLLFNDARALPFGAIKEATRMEDGELRRTLQSLACGKKKVLRKVPVGKDVADADVFHFNDAFTDARRNVHINSIQVKESTEETQRTDQAISYERKVLLEAAIVRIMKARRQLHNEALMAAVIDAAKNHFVPEVRLIKRVIEDLLEREYLRRDEDANVWVYVA